MHKKEFDRHLAAAGAVAIALAFAAPSPAFAHRTSTDFYQAGSARYPASGGCSPALRGLVGERVAITSSRGSTLRGWWQAARWSLA